MQIDKPTLTAQENPDHRLPKANTCQFNLELPPYSTMEVMRTQFQYAMALPLGMDGDDVRVQDVQPAVSQSAVFRFGNEDEDEDEEELFRWYVDCLLTLLFMSLLFLFSFVAEFNF